MGCRVTDVPSGTRQTYGKMANLLFHNPVDVDVSTFPLGPVIKTETSQHSTMNAPYLPTHPSVRVKGPGAGGGVRRQLVNSRQLSPIRETRDREGGREGNDKIESWDLDDICQGSPMQREGWDA